MEKTKDTHLHKAQALASLDKLIDSYISSEPAKANKFLYWLEDYVKFLNCEPQFNPHYLRRYKKGEIIKAHLGYNIGSEEGGLHYCVVVENNNALSSPVVTVVPLTSIKGTMDSSTLGYGEVNLGSDLKEKVCKKRDQLLHSAMVLVEDIKAHLPSEENPPESIEEIKKAIQIANQKITLISKLNDEIEKMKSGSIALVGQMTTISKIRIYDPKRDSDPLGKVKLSNESLDAIDAAITKLFLKK